LIADRDRDFSVRHRVQTGSGANPTCVLGALFPGVKRPRSEADHSSPPSAEVKMHGAIPPLPHTSSWGGA